MLFDDKIIIKSLLAILYFVDHIAFCLIYCIVDPFFVTYCKTIESSNEQVDPLNLPHQPFKTFFEL